MTDWIQAYSGAKLYLGSATEEADFSALHEFDLGAMLAKIGRFGGATRRPMSVAQHSVIVSTFVEADGGDAEDSLLALLHDAHEIALGDRTSPAKAALDRSADLAERQFESRIDRAICRCYGIATALPWHKARDRIKRADIRSLLWEARDALNCKPADDWPARIAAQYGVSPPDTTLHVAEWHAAQFAFIRRQTYLLRALGRPFGGERIAASA